MATNTTSQITQILPDFGLIKKEKLWLTASQILQNCKIMQAIQRKLGSPINKQTN